MDEEKDDIFVDTDDEYKELLKIAANKNKVIFSLPFLTRTHTILNYSCPGSGDNDP